MRYCLCGLLGLSLFAVAGTTVLAQNEPPLLPSPAPAAPFGDSELPPLVPPPILSEGPLIDLRAGLSVPDSALPITRLSWTGTEHRIMPRAVPKLDEFLPRDGDGFGITSLTFASTMGTQPGLTVSPLFRWTFLNGPGTPDVPPQVYDLGLEFGVSHEFSPGWSLAVRIMPLFATDFDNESGDSFRLPASGVIGWSLSDDVQLVAGLAYLDRPDLEFLPIAGVRWRVNEDWELDLVVPRPRIAWRIATMDQKSGQFAGGSSWTVEESETWFYIAGDVGGSSWAIERELNRQDIMGYYDLRLLFGLETRNVGGVCWTLEGGYVFERKLSFERFGGDRDLDPTFVIRWGTEY